jgi:tetratricopeptide (TPR) repeat protein
MQASLTWSLLILLLTGMATAAQIEDSKLSGQPPTAPSTVDPEITVTGTSPDAEQPLPKLPPDEFTNCVSQNGLESIDMRSLAICEAKLNMERHIVIERCINSSGKNTPATVVLACTESLDRKILQGSERFFLFVNRAEAYFAQGDKEHALNDYNKSVDLAPHNAKLYYNRGVFYAAQSANDAALRDLDMALSINPKLVAALHERAKIYQAQSNFSSSIADYSEAVRWQPKTAALWSERGYVHLLQHDYDGVIKDEAEAIRLDPKLALAYFFRGAASARLGDSPGARGDIATALRLDPSLQRYLKTKDTGSVAPPP